MVIACGKYSSSGSQTAFLRVSTARRSERGGVLRCSGRGRAFAPLETELRTDVTVPFRRGIS